MSAARCPSCGARNAPDAAWCALCHVSLREPSPAPASVPAAPAAPTPAPAAVPAQAVPGLTGGHLPQEVVEELVGRLAATEAGSSLPGSLRGPNGARAIGRQAVLAAGGVVAGAMVLLLLMWIVGHLL